MKEKTLWLTRTALMITLLVALQYLTRGLGQFVTGSCVNLILTVSVLTCGIFSGLMVALISPFFAFLLGIGPALIQLVPAISLGNIALVLVIWLLDKKLRGPVLGIIKAIPGALLKFIVLYAVIVKLLLPVLGLAEKQVAALSASFSWSQLVTALIGGIIGCIISPLIVKQVNSKKVA